MNREGEYVEAIPLKGTALVNVGDFLSMCTGEKLKSTVSVILLNVCYTYAIILLSAVAV